MEENGIITTLAPSTKQYPNILHVHHVFYSIKNRIFKAADCEQTSPHSQDVDAPQPDFFAPHNIPMSSQLVTDCTFKR